MSPPIPRRNLLALLLVLLVFGPAACGYQVVGSDASLSGPRPTLAIPPFVNRSTEVGLETIFANSFIQTFNQSRVARALPGDAEADMILLGTLQRVESSSVAYRDIDVSLVRRLTLTVEFTLQDKRRVKTLWKDVEVIYADYVVDQDYHVGETTRLQAVRRAAASLAQRVHGKMMLIF